MATRAVTFRRDWDGETVNFWVYHPDDVTEKLIFTNGMASSSLEEGAPYKLFWIALGVAGSKLKVDKMVQGVDNDFSPLVENWSLPAAPGDPPGKVITYQDYVEFSI